MSISIRTITDSDFEAFNATMARTFARDFNPENLHYRRELFEFDRNYGAFDGDECVGTSGIFTYQMAVPGGSLPTAGVTMVTVKSTHRRQGVLSGMMRAQLDQVRERGEPLAALWASESVIYGRFGYGLAAEAADLSIERTRTALEHSVPTPGRVRMVEAAEAREQWPAIWEQVRLAQPGMCTRSGGWWNNRVFKDPKDWRDGFTANVYVNYEVDGEVRGYLRYRMKSHWADGVPKGTLRVEELMALTDDAYSALWQYAFSVDLMDKIEAPNRKPHEPLFYMLADPRRLMRETHDSLWVRIVDIEKALAGRKYTVEGRVVFGISDPFTPANGGRYLLEGGPAGARCSRTGEPAQIELDVADLGAAYLGGTALQTLARAGRVRGDADALRLADAMFSWQPMPWCPEVF